jgi:phosphate-selective porin
VRFCLFYASLLSILALSRCYAADEIEDLRTEIEKLRQEINQIAPKPASISPVNAWLENRCGQDVGLAAGRAKLKIDGLVQVWHQSFQHDNVGIVRAVGVSKQTENNSLLDNDTFRVRRSELHFAMDIHENIRGFIMADPARESNSTFTPVPTFPAHNQPYNNPNLAFGEGLQVQPGNGAIIPQVLQDAYLNFYGFVPHHDFTIGQFKPPSGEEAWRNSGYLDFVERAMCTGISNVRDEGVMAHGTWLDNRVQYWVGLFNGADGTVLSDPEIVEGGNRSADHSFKDIDWRIAVRPVWCTDHWYGKLELGYARTDGYRGNSGNPYNPAQAVNGLDEEKTAINRQAAWAWYRPGEQVKGWWLRGEWDSGHDRYDINHDVNLLGIGGLVAVNTQTGTIIPLGQDDPAPITVYGWYFSTGYKLSDSIFAESLKAGSGLQQALSKLEFAFRYQTYHNVTLEDPADPSRHTLQLKTSVYEAGINYYLKGNAVRLQLNYDLLHDPETNNALGIHNYRNNVLVAAFQVMF